MATLLHFFFTLSLFISSVFALNNDGVLLLSFKYSILSDPLGVLESWNYDDPTPCSWKGITCESISGSFMVTTLALPDSQLLGSIPQDLGMIPNLHSLDLSNNSLNGSLPPSIFNSSQLESISLSSNVISGNFPDSITSLHSLKFLNLSDNAFAGKLPNSLATLKNLTTISLKNNYFSGSIPGGFDYVEVLDLSFNMFNETLPLDFGGQRLRYLNLSNNKLSGSVPSEFAQKVKSDATIDLSYNNLTGEIPQLLPLARQKTEFFAGNLDLCGKPLNKMCTIPSSLSTPPNATSNGSASAAIAAIPRNIDPSPSSSSSSTNSGPTSTHGGPKVNPTKIAAIVAGDLAGIGLLAILFLYAYNLRKKKMYKNQDQNENPKPETLIHQDTKITKNVSTPTRAQSTTCSCFEGTNGDESSEIGTGSDSDHENNNLTIDLNGGENDKQKCLVMVDGETELEMETLLKASAYVLGTSGSSIVYKAVLGGGRGGGGTAFAVRRIGESGVERMREFENIVRIIAKLKHPNLLKVRGFYWGENEKLVIYDYVSNGSLAGAGYKKVGSSPCQLPFGVRLKIAKGVAMGLAYVHEKKHVHGNVKPSNILLTSEMDPIISDFGLEWLIFGKNNKTKGSNRHFGSKRSISSREEMMIHHDYHHPASSTSSPYMAPATGLLGCTSPYHAPESMKSLKPNPKWDVYSFGIVLLELISGKVFSERELGLWNASSSTIDDENSILRLADLCIKTDTDGRRDGTLTCFKLGFSCASLNPQKRPSMKEALQILEKIPPLSFQ